MSRLEWIKKIIIIVAEINFKIFELSLYLFAKKSGKVIEFLETYE